MSGCREIEEVMFQICHEEATKFFKWYYARAYKKYSVIMA